MHQHGIYVKYAQRCEKKANTNFGYFMELKCMCIHCVVICKVSVFFLLGDAFFFVSFKRNQFKTECLIKKITVLEDFI